MLYVLFYGQDYHNSRANSEVLSVRRGLLFLLFFLLILSTGVSSVEENSPSVSS